MISKRKLALLSITGLLALGLTIGGATYAIFTDSATNSGNTIAAGTINLTQDRDLGDRIPGPMFYTSTADSIGVFPTDINTGRRYGGEAIGGWAPGDSVIRAMNIYNEGTLDANITKLKASVNSLGLSSGDAYNEFIDKMHIKVKYPADNLVLYEGSLSGLLNGYVDIPEIFAAAQGGALNITFEATLDRTANNDIQGENFVFDFEFYSEQDQNN